jgi:glyoxylase I family protein
MITGIEHTAIASFDPHRLAGWYVRHLNLTTILDTGKTIYLRAPNGVVLEFVHAETKLGTPALSLVGLLPDFPRRSET